MPIAEKSRGARVEDNDFNSFPAQRRLDVRPIPSASSFTKRILRAVAEREKAVIFEGYARWADDCGGGPKAQSHSLRADILRTC